MNEDVIADLKQFIAATVTQQTTDLRLELSGKIDSTDKKLSKKIDDLSAAVAEAIDKANEVTGVRLKNHEQRIVRLEKHAAI